ncbi:MAG: galactokinase [Cyclobacteriaceae bacterium]
MTALDIRYRSVVKEQFRSSFDAAPSLLIRAPGRINLIGEHTDYNDGFVLPAAVAHSIYFAIGKSGHASRCSLISLDFDERYDFDLTDMEPLPTGSWQNYVMGVAAELAKTGQELSGFNLVFTGDVPRGSGMSSSAALECGICYGLNKLFDLWLSRLGMARISQLAEHHYAGVQCGIMDQFASLMGKQDQALLLDCRSLEYQYFPVALAQHSLLLLNSNVTHSLADSEYNIRRQQCQQGVKVFQTYYSKVEALRDISMAQFDSVKDKLPIAAAKRCKYVIEENERVKQLTQALSESDLHVVGAILKEAHQAMRYEYEITCPEIDFMADYANKHEKVLGARMMGGGFGGCILVLLEKGAEYELTAGLDEAYHQAFGKNITPIEVEIANGVSLIDP